MFKNRNKIGNHWLTRTSNNSENHEKSSLNLMGSGGARPPEAEG